MCVVSCLEQVLPERGHLVSLEKDLSWVLVGKRFLWQASQGSRNQERRKPLGDKVWEEHDIIVYITQFTQCLMSQRDCQGTGPRAPMKANSRVFFWSSCITSFCKAWSR
jgi:hypothetical protein